MMKALVSPILILTLALSFFSTLAQTIEPPEKVQAGFEKKYLGESMIYEWREQEGNYIVTFTHQDKFKYALLNAEGKWQEDGEAIEYTDIPESIYKALPELDITAFVHESFISQNNKDQKGYLLVYETDVERIDFWVSNQGKVLREKHYDIPKAAEEKLEEEDKDTVDWGGGK